jgi:hypothetical protein
MILKHAMAPSQGAEFAVCGLAYDAHESGDHEEPVVLAREGEAVTCGECRRIVIEYRKIRIGRAAMRAKEKT